jgi:8-oxo-dGTP diphosphatase
MENIPRIGVGVIIKNAKQVLLLRRKNVHGEGSWSTPGGHLDYNESPEVCAIREVKEETNLNIETAKFIAITNDIFITENKHYITIWMESEYVNGTPILNAPYESDAIDWFYWDKLPQPLFIPFKNLVNGQSYPSISILQ